MSLPSPASILPTHRAWAAGFYDGEGSTSLVNGAQLRLTIGQQDPQLLVKFQSIMLGIGHIQAPKSLKPNGQPRAHYYRICRYVHSEWAIRVMWPYLGDPKRQQYLAAKEAYRVSRTVSR